MSALCPSAVRALHNRHPSECCNELPEHFPSFLKLLNCASWKILSSSDLLFTRDSVLCMRRRRSVLILHGDRKSAAPYGNSMHQLPLSSLSLFLCETYFTWVAQLYTHVCLDRELIALFLGDNCQYYSGRKVWLLQVKPK